MTSAEIIAACDQGDAERVEELVRGDPLLADAIGPHDKTPLHVAAEHDHVAVARVLLAAGAGIRARTSWGMTPLKWAATMGSNGVADLLVAAGAELDLWSAAGLGRLDAPTPSTTRSTRRRSSGPWKAGTTRPPASSGPPREVVRR